MNWTIYADERIAGSLRENGAEFQVREDVENAYIELVYRLPFEVEGDEYILFPACCYDGNRFDVMKKKYPPLFTKEEAKIDMPVVVTDVPRLEKDGSGVIEVTTGDVSVPCVGVFSKKRKLAWLLYTIQQIDGINLGLSYEKGKIGITYPHMRKHSMYRWPFMCESTDKGCSFIKGQKLQIPFRMFEFPCESMESFYHVYMENRKCMGLDAARATALDTKKLLAVQMEKLNRYNWREEPGFYGTETVLEDTPLPVELCWQPGWCGGGMYTYALMKLGGELEQRRVIRTLKFLFKNQTPCGFFYESADSEGNVERGIFRTPGSEEWVLVRKSADILYFLFKHFEVFQEKGIAVPKSFEEGTRKLADAFVQLWKTYRQFGQVADLNTGELVVGGSQAGVIACGGLALAAEYFKEPTYLEVAKESCAYYCENSRKNGYTVGGPGEILHCPDSESAFALLESATVLYEQTKEEVWLEHCRYALDFASSWVVSYNYRFPEGSEFHRLQKHTVGSVFANAQNKHSAPGICTFSGYSIYKVYQWTKEERYLELFLDITRGIGQYMSTEENPIYSWTVAKDATLLEEADRKPVESKRLLPGYICERVNMSDWETEGCVGGVFCSSCSWCEAALLMTHADGCYSIF